MKRISVTGKVPKKMKEMKILEGCSLKPEFLRDDIKEFFTAMSDLSGTKEKVRVTVVVDVEWLD